MSDGLTARLRSSLRQRVDCSAVLTASWARLRADELAGRTVELERDGRVPLGDLFEVKGNAAGRARFTGDLSQVDRLAAGLSEGTVTVEGNLGHEAGMGMAAGALVIEGNAGERTGAAAPGFKRGMTGGELIVRGSAGADAGASMRRGLLVIGGSAGERAGLNMIANFLAIASYPALSLILFFVDVIIVWALLRKTPVRKTTSVVTPIDMWTLSR